MGKKHHKHNEGCCCGKCKKMAGDSIRKTLKQYKGCKVTLVLGSGETEEDIKIKDVKDEVLVAKKCGECIFINIDCICEVIAKEKKCCCCCECDED